MADPPLGSNERAYNDGYAAAQKEIERLKAALQQIIDECDGPHTAAGEIARCALEEKWKGAQTNHPHLLTEPADEIERLREENERLREALAGRLRAALATERARADQ